MWVYARFMLVLCHRETDNVENNEHVKTGSTGLEVLYLVTIYLLHMESMGLGCQCKHNKKQTIIQLQLLWQCSEFGVLSVISHLLMRYLITGPRVQFV